ncbi:MAG: glutaminase A [Bauldia sp.]
MKDEAAGAVANYIPELSVADPADFGIAVATADGAVYAVGDADKPFTIQSISKAFVYGHVLAEYGREHILTKVGVEPSGDAFNAIVFDEASNRPFNPMVNSGAIATAALIKGAAVGDRIATMRALFERLAGRTLAVNDAVFRSEKATGHRNRAIAWMMLNAGMIEGDPDEVLDVYFTQCSIEVTCRDLAVMAATLANGGVQPLTGERVLPTASVRDVISVMSSCGMYNYAGQWSFEVGLPAKSGVGGGIIAVAPGQLGIAVYSPPLDQLGNSVRGIAAFKAISRDFNLHVFGTHQHSGAIVRREIGGEVVRSKRLRSSDELRILDTGGKRIRLIELQGALYFGTAERLVRRVEALAGEVDWVILDFRRVHVLDEAATDLIIRASESSPGAPELLFAGLSDQRLGAKFAARLGEARERALFPDADAALQWCEDRLIGHAAAGLATHYGLADLAIFAGLSGEEIRLLQQVVQARVFDTGDVIIREGDPAKLFYVLARGTVGVRLRGHGQAEGAGKRIATFGPGLSFGETALFHDGRRSADVIAEEHVVCYGFMVQDLQEIGREHPNILVTILSNVTREMGERLRRANEEIRALET